MTSLLVTLWTKPTHSKEPWSFKKNLTKFNAEFKHIYLPTSTFKSCRLFQESEFDDFVTCWIGKCSHRTRLIGIRHKASELRSFLLVYFIILEDLLPKEYFSHHLLLVEAVFILSDKKALSNQRIQTAHELLDRYVLEFARLYGKSLV